MGVQWNAYERVSGACVLFQDCTATTYNLQGDPVYGGKPRKTREIIGQILLNFPRQALHAQKLSLTHPQTEQVIQWEADVPDDMDNLLQMIRQHSEEEI